MYTLKIFLAVSNGNSLFKSIEILLLYSMLRRLLLRCTIFAFKTVDLNSTTLHVHTFLTLCSFHSKQVLKMATRKEVDLLLTHGFIRKKQRKYHKIIPNDIMNMCFIFYHLPFEYLKWSNNFKSADGLLLTDDNKCVTRYHKKGWSARSHRYILADCDPVFTGQHCWRIQVLYKNTQSILYEI